MGLHSRFQDRSQSQAEVGLAPCAQTAQSPEWPYSRRSGWGRGHIILEPGQQCACLCACVPACAHTHQVCSSPAQPLLGWREPHPAHLPCHHLEPQWCLGPLGCHTAPGIPCGVGHRAWRAPAWPSQAPAASQSEPGKPGKALPLCIMGRCYQERQWLGRKGAKRGCKEPPRPCRGRRRMAPRCPPTTRSTLTPGPL